MHLPEGPFRAQVNVVHTAVQTSRLSSQSLNPQAAAAPQTLQQGWTGMWWMSHVRNIVHCRLIAMVYRPIAKTEYVCVCMCIYVYG